MKNRIEDNIMIKIKNYTLRPMALIIGLFMIINTLPGCGKKGFYDKTTNSVDSVSVEKTIEETTETTDGTTDEKTEKTTENALVKTKDTTGETTEENAQTDSTELYRELLDDYCILYDSFEKGDDYTQEFCDKYGDGVSDMAVRGGRVKHGYAFDDITGDGVDELIIGLLEDDGSRVEAVFTINDGKYINLITAMERYSVKLLSDNSFFAHGSDGAGFSTNERLMINNAGTEVALKESYVYDAADVLYDEGDGSYDNASYEDDRFWFYTTDENASYPDFQSTTYAEAQSYINAQTSKEVQISFINFNDYISDGIQDETVGETAPTSTDNYIELKEYMGTDFFDFVNMFKDMYDQHASSGLSYTNGYLQTANDDIENSQNIVSFIGITGECNYTIHGIYYGMPYRDAINRVNTLNPIEQDINEDYALFYLPNNETIRLSYQNGTTIDCITWFHSPSP